MTVEVRTDMKPLKRFIDRWTRIKMPQAMRRHFNKAGAVAANSYRKSVPKGPTGNLRKSVRYKVFAREASPGALPQIGIAVAPMGRLGAHRHLVEFGHRAVGHKPGLTYRGNIVVAHPYAEAARASAEKRLTEGLDAAVQAAVREAEAG